MPAGLDLVRKTRYNEYAILAIKPLQNISLLLAFSSPSAMQGLFSKKYVFTTIAKYRLLSVFCSLKEMCVCKYQRNNGKKSSKSLLVSSVQKILLATNLDSKTCAKPGMQISMDLRTVWARPS